MSGTIEIEVAPSELIDKPAILEINRERIHERYRPARRNVGRSGQKCLARATRQPLGKIGRLGTFAFTLPSQDFLKGRPQTRLSALWGGAPGRRGTPP
jgi:hypothetical protein